MSQLLDHSILFQSFSGSLQDIFQRSNRPQIKQSFQEENKGQLWQEPLEKAAKTCQNDFLQQVDNYAKTFKQSYVLSKCYGTNAVDDTRQVMMEKKFGIWLTKLGYNVKHVKSESNKEEDLFRQLSHTYITIDNNDEYFNIVELNFKKHFMVSFSTLRYQTAMDILPDVFVGTYAQLQQLTNLMCDEMVQQFDQHNLMLPPWRDRRSILSKWFAVQSRNVPLTIDSQSETYGQCKIKFLSYDYANQTLLNQKYQFNGEGDCKVSSNLIEDSIKFDEKIYSIHPIQLYPQRTSNTYNHITSYSNQEFIQTSYQQKNISFSMKQDYFGQNKILV